MILLDTHCFVWWVSDRGQLSDAARKAIETERGSIAISVVTSWEIALLHKKQRLRLPIPPADFISRSLERYGIDELALKREAVIASTDLPDIHNDPFDRILVAEALRNRCEILTKDGSISKYPGIQTIW